MPVAVRLRVDEMSTSQMVGDKQVSPDAIDTLPQQFLLVTQRLI